MPATQIAKTNSQYFKEFSGKTIKLRLIDGNEEMYGRFMAISSANREKSYYKIQNDILYFDKITDLELYKNGTVSENYLNYDVIRISENEIAEVAAWEGDI